MSTSDVRNIESLQRLRNEMLELADNWQTTLQEIQVSLHRAEDYFGSQVPQYWRHQSELAERELTEAKDNLQRKQSAARASDRVQASDAQKRVARAKTRLDVCRSKLRTAKSLAIKVKQQCDEIQGPMADLSEQSDNRLPQAAAELKTLLEALHRYAESQGLSSPPPPVGDRPAGNGNT
ncbi:hypothetical protein FYK55_03170 [Roseiconus nitratireducens]|uniref:Uncharacterized protein n=1 Tax=Roseiconus nitratireducens TaxID=2605748 RepID=A0A5M6DEH1_9BACT|nr:hypothetical protein [Roseiconus nitratireducens]KAA5545928.1 hypothetical protein FYK55_03170 [Roseiconus nitratireducens]